MKLALSRFRNTRSFLTISFLILACSVITLIPAVSGWLQEGERVVRENAKEPSESWALKLYFRNEGVAEINLDELGTPLPDPARLRLYHYGRRVPLWRSDRRGQTYVRFFVSAPLDPNTTDSIYWLVDASREEISDDLAASLDLLLPFPETPAAVLPNQDIPGDQYWAKQELEENLIYNPLVESGDSWLWFTLPAPGTRSIEFNLRNIATGSAQMEVELWAGTQAKATPDHHLVLKLNGLVVLDQTFDGKGNHLLTASLPAGVLQEGRNVLELSAPGDTGVLADVISVDRIALFYPRRLLAEKDRLDFVGQGGEVVIGGFSGPVLVLDITDAEAPNEVLQKQTSEFTLQTEPGRRYFAVGPRGYLDPTRISPAILQPDLRRMPPAEFLALGPPELLKPLQPLLDFRKSQGFSVAEIPLEAIFDQFSAGFPQPQAIRSFLRFAYDSWAQKPRFVLLVGDGTYDPRGYQGPASENISPVFMTTTVFGGETASDVIFVPMDDDERPELAIGRVPARTPRQVATWVSNVLAYEARIPSASAPDILAIADGQDPLFRQEAEKFLGLFPYPYNKQLYSPRSGVVGANQEIARRLAEQPDIVTYFGHGSLNMWGQDGLFTNEDVQALPPNSFPSFVISMTCLNGYFIHPKAVSLAEAWLLQPEAGAVAVLASTSLTRPADQSFLTRAFVGALLENPSLTVGEALLQAQQQAPRESPGAVDVMKTFLLFGDPAMRWIGSAQ